MAIIQAFMIVSRIKHENRHVRIRRNMEQEVDRSHSHLDAASKSNDDAGADNGRSTEVMPSRRDHQRRNSDDCEEAGTDDNHGSSDDHQEAGSN